MLKSFTVCTATKGGFYVLAAAGDYGDLREIVFSGTLDDCLDFVRREMTYPPEGE